jgi:PAS domain S-box-containing protein
MKTKSTEKPVGIVHYFIFRTALLSVIFFGTLTILAVLSLNSFVQSQFIRGQRAATRMIAEEMETRIDTLIIAVQTASRYWGSGNFSEPGDKQFQAFGDALISSLPSLSALWILDRETGMVKGTVPMDPHIVGYDCSRLDIYPLKKTETRFESFLNTISPALPLWSKISINPFFSMPVFAIGLEAGEDFLLGWVDPQVFLLAFFTPRFFDVEFFSYFACDTEGNLIVHTDPRLVAQRGNVRSIPAVRESLQEDRPSLFLGYAPLFGKEKVVITTQPVQKNGWVVGIVQREEKTRLPIYTLAEGGLLFLLFFSLLVLLTVQRSAHALEKEIQPFIKSFSAISEGNYDFPIPPQRFTEIGALRSSAQAMQKAIKERERQLAEALVLNRIILDTIPVRVFWKDRNFRFMGCNTLFARDAGKETPEELVGLSDYDLVWKDEADRYQKEDREVILSGTPKLGIEHRQIFPNNQVYWHLTNKVPLRNAEGEVIGVLGTYEDITRQKQIEEEIRMLNQELERRVEERTRDLIKTNQELQQTFDSLSRTQEMLVQAEKLSALGKLAASVAHELNTPLGAILSSTRSLIELLKTLLEEEMDYYCSLNSTEKNFYRNVTKAAFSSYSGNSILSEEEKYALRKRLEEEGFPDPRDTAELLLDLSFTEKVDEILPALKNPKQLELLHHVVRIIRLHHSASVIDIAAEKASKVVAALRRYMQQGKVPGYTRVEVEQDLETVLVLLHNRIKEGVQVIRRYRGVQALGSSEQLTQVWLNLITNALQSMNFQGELVLETLQEGDKVQVCIIDNGPGIPEEIQPYIFEPFFTTKPEEEGTGIGLNICRNIIREHGGNLRFESRPGYTRFIVTLPAYTAPSHTS